MDIAHVHNTQITNYPNIKKLYIALSTGLPSGTTVDRLFSKGGCVFTPLRSSY